MELFLALAINQSSCVHKAAAVIQQEARRQEKRFLLNPDWRQYAWFVYCRCVFPTEDLKHEAVHGHACVHAIPAFSREAVHAKSSSGI